MNSVENIIKVISSDAENEANRILSEAQETADKKFEKMKADITKEFEDKKSIVDKKFNDTVSSAEKSANMEKGKIELKLKQDLLDKIFAEVLENLCDLKQTSYEKLIENLLIKYAKNEDAVSLSVDSKVDEKFLTSLKVLKERKWKYVISKSNIKGGFVLSNAISDTVVSFESIVEEMREQYAYQISNELFK